MSISVKIVPSPTLLPWLTHQSVLSEKLKAVTGEAKLLILNQVLRSSNWWEKYQLALPAEAIFCREIMMSSQENNYWYARTIIPQACYIQFPSLFKRLDNEPLGNLIFYTREVERIALRHYSIDASCLEFYWLKPFLDSQVAYLWLRLSHMLVMQTESFYLVEILLPPLESLHCDH